MTGTNPTAAYSKLDSTTQTFTAYKAGIDGNSVAAMRIVSRFAPHAQASPNMTVMVDAGSLFDGMTLTEKAAQTTATITAPVSHARIDRVVIDNITGTVSVVQGAEAVSPSPPAIPSGKSPIAQVLLQTSTTAITNAVIADERNFEALGPGGFGAQTSIPSAATCDLGTVLSRNAMITGTTTISSFGASAATTSPIYLVEFAASLTLTNSANLRLPGGSDIVTAAGDTAVAEYIAAGAWRVRSYQRASGKALRSSSPTIREFTSDTTYYPPAGVSILVEQVGGGGGGGGYGSGRSDGSAGGATSFGSIIANGGGGGGGFSSTAFPGTGGTGGSGTADFRQAGQAGSVQGATSTTGGNSRLGPGAAATAVFGAGPSADPNTGGGGAGAPSVSAANSAGSGGAGEYARTKIDNPASSYPIVIGPGGNGGSGANPGGNGGSGLVRVTEY